MRKLTISLAAMALFFAGCQKPELVGPHAENLSFEATVEEFDAQTRTSLAPGNHVVWSADDRLAIFQGSAIADEYKLEEGSEGLNCGSFQWVAKDNVVNDDFNAGTELPCNVAFYPYSQGLLLTGVVDEVGRTIFAINLVLPQVQTYVQNSFGKGAFPMVAVTENMADRNLKFKNVLGAMKLQLKGTQVVKSIKVEGANGEKLSGAATVEAFADNHSPFITMTGTDEASKSVTLDCGDGVQLSKAKATDFIIALPPVHVSRGFTVTVTDVEEKEYTTSATIENHVYRSYILVMPEVSLGSDEEDSGEGDLSLLNDYIDEYGVNHGKGVKIGETVWAPVNCGYHATDYRWGKLYQWGRKYGQGYDGDAVTPELLELSEGGVSLQGGQSAKNKNVFFCVDELGDSGDWLYQSDDQLWNSGTEESPVKTEYDPCPEGWRVPTYAELIELSQHHSPSNQSGYWFSGTTWYSSEVAQVFFPAAGYRYDSGDISFLRGHVGCYWSSSPYPNSYLVYGFQFPGRSTPLKRMQGCSVRCVQNASGEPVRKDENENLEVPVVSVSLNSTSLKLYEGNFFKLVAKVGPVDATYGSIIWSSSDSAVATVDQSGWGRAISVGTVEIYAQAGDVVATCSVTVKVPAVATADYVDEYGVNQGKGIKIGETVWAPVNCGYHATDYQWGKLYQWGRKYGQGFDDDATTPELSEGGVSLQDGQSEKNKNVFFICLDYPYYWLDPIDDQLWNSGTEGSPVKTEYDPCPDGWRVPTSAELHALCQNYSSWVTNGLNQLGCWFSGASSYSSEVAQVFFPAAGYRTEGGNCCIHDHIGYYLSSRIGGGLTLSVNSSSDPNVNYWDHIVNACGYSVRCVQE